MKRVVVIVCLALSAIAVAAPAIPVAQRKFDHDRHANAVNASGRGVSADCKDCHRMDATTGAVLGGKEHDRCAKCHTFPSSCATLKQGGPKGPSRVCEICHVAKRRECLPDDLPAPPVAPSFSPKFTHGKHLAFGSGIETACVQCHAAQAAAPVPPAGAGGQSHRLCATCHNATGVAANQPITSCFNCHQPGVVAKPVTPSDPYRLAGFDHKVHHLASQRTAGCTACHDRLIGAAERALPRPSMLGCLTKCHDGAKAFSAVGTKCTMCHKGSEPPPAARQQVAFSHAQHANRNVRISDCGTCHAVESDGKLAPPLARKDHQPCANAGCHQTEFANRITQICGVCHDTVAPWARNTSRAKRPAHEEWFETMNHVSHLEKTGASSSACASCHGDKLAGAPRPASHDGCVGCHGKGLGPPMSQCGTCHLKDPPARAPRTEWSVAAQFAKVKGHAKHAVDRRTGKAAQCLDCHPSVTTAANLAQIRPSTMQQCGAACHDGKTAFKTTGFGCAKCHARVAVNP